MSDPDSDPSNELSPELWAIELHYMAFGGFNDLTSAASGIRDGQLFHPTSAYISSAFNLLAAGLERDPADFTDNVAEFLSALNAGAEQQHALLKAALNRLAEQLGFSPEAPAVIATFKLSGED